MCNLGLPSFNSKTNPDADADDYASEKPQLPSSSTPGNVFETTASKDEKEISSVNKPEI